MKRIISFFLMLVYCQFLFISSASANEEPVFITICQDDMQSYFVIPSGDDLLFSGEDLSEITGYDYKNDGKTAVFKRGIKAVKVDISKNRIYPMDGLANLGSEKLNGEIRKVENKYYFSGSQLLPWLNVTCFEKEGILYAAADAVSLWDFAADFDPEQFEFDFVKSCNKLGTNSKWLKAGAYMRNKGIGMVLDAIPVSLDHTFGSYLDYYDIFDEMFQNKESSVYAFKELTGQSKKIKSAFDMIEYFEEMENLPDEIQAFAALNKSLSAFESAADYALYYYTFRQDNSEKLAIIDAITGNRYVHKYPDAMLAACFDIKDSYSDLWTGLEKRLMQDLTEESIKMLISAGTDGKMMEGALKALGLYKAFKPDWVKGVARVSKYEAMAACGLNVYKDYFGGSHIFTIQYQRCHAFLYLYACEKNWRTMADYAEKKDKYKIAEEFNSIADSALQWQGKFLASSPASINDSHEYGKGYMKEEYTEKLLKMFLNLNKADSPTLESDETEASTSTTTPTPLPSSETKYVYYHYLQMYDDMAFSIGYKEDGNYSYYHEIVLDKPLKEAGSPYAEEGYPTYGYHRCTEDEGGFTDDMEFWFAGSIRD